MGRTLQILGGLAATACVAAWMWLWFQPTIPETVNQPTSEPSSDYAVGGRLCNLASVRSISDQTARRLRQDECARLQEQDRKEQSDLDQQTRTANASEAIVQLTLGQTRITLLAAILSMCTTALLIWTLWETRSANRAELRAYVLPDISLVHKSHLPPRERRKVPNELLVTVHSKNSGQTPATGFVNWMGVAIIPPEDEETLEIPKALTRKSVSVISAQGTINTPYIVNPTALETAGLITGKLQLFVWGRMSYLDIFGRRRSSTYRMKYSGIWPPFAGATMTFCDRGNSHT